MMLSFGGESASIRSNTVTQEELDEPLNSLCCPTYYRRDRRMGNTLPPRTPGRHHVRFNNFCTSDCFSKLSNLNITTILLFLYFCFAGNEIEPIMNWENIYNYTKTLTQKN